MSDIASWEELHQGYYELKVETTSQGVVDVGSWAVEVVRAHFAPALTSVLRGELALADPSLACSELTCNVTGKVVLVKRGECFFTVKVRQAKLASALAVCLSLFVALRESEGWVGNIKRRF
jgi:hypothetical protein